MFNKAEFYEIMTTARRRDSCTNARRSESMAGSLWRSSTCSYGSSCDAHRSTSQTALLGRWATGCILSSFSAISGSPTMRALHLIRWVSSGMAQQWMTRGIGVVLTSDWQGWACRLRADLPQCQGYVASIFVLFIFVLWYFVMYVTVCEAKTSGTRHHLHRRCNSVLQQRSGVCGRGTLLWRLALLSLRSTVGCLGPSSFFSWDVVLLISPRTATMGRDRFSECSESCQRDKRQP